jgi:intein/homing endonuclease
MTELKVMTPAQVLESRGIAKAAAMAGWHERTNTIEGKMFNGWAYPIPGSEALRWKNADPDAPKGTKYRWLPSQPKENPPRYYYLPGFQAAVQKAHGEAYLASGEPDVLAFVSAGYLNAFCWLNGEATQPPTLSADLDKLGVTLVVTFPDCDLTGRNMGKRLKETLSSSAIVCALPAAPDSSFDINKLWIQVGFDKEAFKTVLKKAPEMEFAPAATPETPPRKPLSPIAPDGEKRFAEYVAELTQTINQIPHDRQGHFRCVNPSHPDAHPSARVSYDKDSTLGIYICVCQAKVEWKTVGEWLGNRWEDWKERHPLTQGDKADAKKHQPQNTPAPAPKLVNAVELNGKTPILSPSGLSTDQYVNPQMLVFTVDPATIPLDKVLHSADEASTLYAERMRGLYINKKPLPFPFRAFHHLGGLCQVATPGELYGILGMSGGGKCVAENTIIATEMGLVPIFALVPDMLSEDEFASINLSVQTPTGCLPASHIYNSGEKQTITITTHYGYSLTGTTIHPVLTLNNDGMKGWKNLSELNVGDYIAIQRHAGVWGKNIDIGEYDPPGHMIRSDHNGSMNLHSGIRTKLSLPIKVDEQTAYILGVITGDGGLTRRNYVHISSADEEILDEVREWGERVGLKLRHRANYDYIFNSATLREWLKSIGLSGYSYEKQVPSIIMVAPKEIVRSYLQGLFDTDGSGLGRQSSAIEYSTSSTVLAEQVHLLLLNFGIISRKVFKRNKKRGAWRIFIHGDNARKFYKDIEFRLTRKQETKRFLSETSNPNHDMIPFIPEVQCSRAEDYPVLHGLYHPSYKKLREMVSVYPELETLIEPEYFWDRIDSKFDSGVMKCYDLTIPDGHAFVANGIVSHNTSFLESMIDNSRQEGDHWLLISPEIPWWKTADRLSQRWSGATVTQSLMHELYHYEEKHPEGRERHGVRLSDQMVELSIQFNEIAKNEWPGKLFIIDEYGVDFEYFLASIFASAQYLKQKHNIVVQRLGLDYIQLMEAPISWRQTMTYEHMIKRFKALNAALETCGYITSQVRKSDTAAAMKSHAAMTQDSGMNIREFSFRNFMTLTPGHKTENGKKRVANYTIFNVTKNSEGMKGEVELETDWSKMLYKDHGVGQQRENAGTEPRKQRKSRNDGIEFDDEEIDF